MPNDKGSLKSCSLIDVQYYTCSVRNARRFVYNSQGGNTYFYPFVGEPPEARYQIHVVMLNCALNISYKYFLF